MGMEISRLAINEKIARYALTAPVVALYCLVARMDSLPASLPMLLAACAGLVVIISAAAFLSRIFPHLFSRNWIILSAGVFRLLFVMRPPELSDDIFRYLLDGLNLLNGLNPYQHSPAEVSALGLMPEELIGLVNHPELASIYPPFAQLFFAAGAGIRLGVYGMKLLFAGIDCLNCIFISELLSRKKLPQGLCVLYAWHPLPVLEIAGSGHLEAVAIFLLLLCMKTMQKDPYKATSNVMAGLLLAASVLTKLIPVIFAPFLLVTSSNKKVFILAGIAAAVSVTVPFAPFIKNGLHTLRVYAANWEFASLGFKLLHSVTNSGDISRLVLSGVFCACFAVIFYQFARKQILLEAAMYHTAVSFALLSPTLHPWYNLYFLAFLPLRPKPSGIVLSFTAFLPYFAVMTFRLDGVWSDPVWVSGLIWSGFFAALLSERFLPVLGSIKNLKQLFENNSKL